MGTGQRLLRLPGSEGLLWALTTLRTSGFVERSSLPSCGSSPPVAGRAETGLKLAVRLLLMVVTLGGGVLAGWAVLAAPAASDAERTGGDTTVFVTGRNAFSMPAANASDAERAHFAIGNSFFRRNWVVAPASTGARDGLGPHFNARSCGGCHVQDGRGEPPQFSQQAKAPGAVALILRLSVQGTVPGETRPDPVYGEQLRTQAIPGVRPEGKLRVTWRTVPGRYDDGEPFALKRPQYGIEEWGYGPPGDGLLLSPRLAPQLAGVGLLEAIPEDEIVANMRTQAQTGSAIKGRTNRVWDAQGQRQMLGRFGWKANVASLAHQTAAAFVNDMGITSALFPSETCKAAQSDCRAAPSGGRVAGAPEIDAETFADVVRYQALLAPAAQRVSGNREQLRRGAILFRQAQCAACHRPSYVTATPPFPDLSTPAVTAQRIWPYTDLLLHDMGPALGDGRPDGMATGRDWKTPALWGLGLLKAVNGHTRLMHDGRADGIAEAILWHGGEGASASARFKKMSKSDRLALIQFVESL